MIFKPKLKQNLKKINSEYALFTCPVPNQKYRHIHRYSENNSGILSESELINDSDSDYTLTVSIKQINRYLALAINKMNTDKHPPNFLTFSPSVLSARSRHRHQRGHRPGRARGHVGSHAEPQRHAGQPGRQQRPRLPRHAVPRQGGEGG